MDDRQLWYAGVDWGSQSHHVVLTDARRPEDRREKLQAWRRGAGRDGRLADDGELRRRARSNPGRDRSATRPGSRDADRARLPGPRHQPQAARPLPRPFHRGRRQGRPPRRRGAGRRLAHRSSLLPPARGCRPDRRRVARMVAHRRGSRHERNRLANRVREQLWRYYPQALLELERRPRRRLVPRTLAKLAPTPTRRAVCAKRRSPNCSSAIASVASTPPAVLDTSCAGRRCASPPARSRPRAPMSRCSSRAARLRQPPDQRRP